MQGADPLGTIFFGTIVASYLAVAAVRALARRWNVLAFPNERSSHVRPVPLCGGVVLVVCNLIAWVGYALVHHQTLSLPHVLAFLAGAVLVAGISFVDDLGHVPYGIRLAVHGAAAIVFMTGFSWWNLIELPVVGSVQLGLVGPLVTLLWMVGLTNAYNFMDGIDGMAAGQASVAGLGWIALGWFSHHSILMLLGAVLAASALGFLGHNWQPATIFMGDVGATFLGYSFAALAVLSARYDPRFALAGVLLVWPVIFDCTFTVLRRLWRHEGIFAGHRSFLFHRLVLAGWSHAQASSLYMVLPLAGAALAVTWARSGHPVHIAIAMGVCGLCVSLWALVRRQELRASPHTVIVSALREGADQARTDELLPLEVSSRA